MSNTIGMKKPTLDGTPVNIRETIKSLALNMGPDVSDEEKKEHAKVLIKIFEKKLSPKEAMQISDEDMALMYSFAHALFNSGKYAEACELFKMLFVFEPYATGFATALGSCYHKLKQYDTAVLFYLMATCIDPVDPVPYLYAYDCFMQLQDLNGAYLSLVEAAKIAKLREAWKPIQNKAEALLKGFDPSKISSLIKNANPFTEQEDEKTKT